MNLGSIGHSAASMPVHEQSGFKPSALQKNSSGGSVQPDGELASATNSFLSTMIKNSLDMHRQLFDFAKQQLDEEKDDG